MSWPFCCGLAQSQNQAQRKRAGLCAPLPLHPLTKIGVGRNLMQHLYATGKDAQGTGLWNGIAMREFFVSPRRILALLLPRLPTDRLKRRWKALGKLDKRPLVVAAKIDNALRLTAVDASAAALGLYPGKALADARAMIPHLAVIRANEVADRKLLEEIADWCLRYTPLVALDPPNGLFLDITGCAHLFGGEAAMGNTIHHSVQAQGFLVCLALAGTAEAARALAQYQSGIIVPPGKEAEAVAKLPTEALAADPLIIHALRRAGLKTIGQVALRTRHELAARFGGSFVSLLERCLGHRGGPITPRRALPELMAERSFADPVLTAEIIFATLSSLAESLSSVLESRGQGGRIWEAWFFRADGQVRRIAIETGQAMRDPKALLRLFQEKIDVLADPLDPGFGFDVIRFSVMRGEDLKAECRGLDSQDLDRDIQFLIDKLSARFGARRVLRFVPQDTHIPEAASIAVPAQHAEINKLPWRLMRAAGEAPRRPLRLFAKPEPIEVRAEMPEGPPLHFRWRRALHRVARFEGPERIAMEWWRHSSPQPTRDYYRIEDDAGRRYWLYRDRVAREIAQPRWFLHGLFA